MGVIYKRRFSIHIRSAVVALIGHKDIAIDYLVKQLGHTLIIRQTTESPTLLTCSTNRTSLLVLARYPHRHVPFSYHTILP